MGEPPRGRRHPPPALGPDHGSSPAAPVPFAGFPDSADTSAPDSNKDDGMGVGEGDTTAPEAAAEYNGGPAAPRCAGGNPRPTGVHAGEAPGVAGRALIAFSGNGCAQSTLAAELEARGIE
eukprot:875752-Pleurochrysis_carterae.AAC.2